MSDLERNRLVALWKQLPGRHEPGLTSDEIASTESRFSVRFPPDLRLLLQSSLPVDTGFPDWRSGVRRSRAHDGSMRTVPINEALAWPRDGLLFDLEHNDVWLDSLGPRPSNVETAKELFERAAVCAPRLIPVYAHRYIPAEPHDVDNPIFSVHQSDIIHYGANLREYLEIEFFGRAWDAQSFDRCRRITFWSDIVDD